MFRVGEVKKTYWAIVKNCPPAEEGELVNWLVRNEKQNKSYAYDTERTNAKKAVLHYKVIARSDNYYLLAIDLKTGRHHQIRCQLAKMGCPIKGRLEIWFSQLQSGRRHQPAFPQCRIHPSRIETAGQHCRSCAC